MKIKAVKGYRDLQEKRYIFVDEEYEVEDKRAEEIINAGYAVSLEPPKKYKKETVKEETNEGLNEESKKETEEPNKSKWA